MSNNSIDYEYNKRLALFELDVIKNEKEKLRGKGHKFMNIPDAIAPELKDEVYSIYETSKIELIEDGEQDEK